MAFQDFVLLGLKRWFTEIGVNHVLRSAKRQGNFSHCRFSHMLGFSISFTTITTDSEMELEDCNPTMRNQFLLFNHLREIFFKKEMQLLFNFIRFYILSGQERFKSYHERFKLCSSKLHACGFGIRQSVSYLLSTWQLLNQDRKNSKHCIALNIKWPPSFPELIFLPPICLTINNFIDSYFRDLN